MIRRELEEKLVLPGKRNLRHYVCAALESGPHRLSNQGFTTRFARDHHQIVLAHTEAVVDHKPGKPFDSYIRHRTLLHPSTTVPNQFGAAKYTKCRLRRSGWLRKYCKSE